MNCFICLWIFYWSGLVHIELTLKSYQLNFQFIGFAPKGFIDTFAWLLNEQSVKSPEKRKWKSDFTVVFLWQFYQSLVNEIACQIFIRQSMDFHSISISVSPTFHVIVSRNITGRQIQRDRTGVDSIRGETP